MELVHNANISLELRLKKIAGQVHRHAAALPLTLDRPNFGSYIVWSPPITALGQVGCTVSFNKTVESPGSRITGLTMFAIQQSGAEIYTKSLYPPTVPADRQDAYGLHLSEVVLEAQQSTNSWHADAFKTRIGLLPLSDLDYNSLHQVTGHV